MTQAGDDGLAAPTLRVLAVASSGGHWDQLMVVSGAWDAAQVVYAVTLPRLAERNGVSAEIIPDFSARTPWRLLIGILPILRMVIRARPHVAISTGAAPGVVALFVAKLMGAQTIWIDSIANVERLSLSGRLACVFSDVCLVQWEALARSGRLQYWGAVA
jgi:hypothetical protein